MEKYRIVRDGERPLVFTGDEIGFGTTGGINATRWTAVTLYKTAKGRFVAEIERLTKWQGERDLTKAEAFDTLTEMVEWLKEDNGGELGSASQEAIEKACLNDPGLEAEWVEEA